MNEGRVLMEFVSRKKIREEKNSYGLITVKITKVSVCSQPYFLFRCMNIEISASRG